MFNPEELNHKISQSFSNQEKVEAEAQGLNRKIRRFCESLGYRVP